MGDRIGGYLALAALFATFIALVAFPPAFIVVAAAVVWWMVQTDRKDKQQFWDRQNREIQERDDAERRELYGDDTD